MKRNPDLVGDGILLVGGAAVVIIAANALKDLKLSPPTPQVTLPSTGTGSGLLGGSGPFGTYQPVITPFDFAPGSGILPNILVGWGADLKKWTDGLFKPAQPSNFPSVNATAQASTTGVVQTPDSTSTFI